MAEDSSQADTQSYSLRSQGQQDEVLHISPSEAEWQVNSQNDLSNRWHAASDRSSRKGNSRTPRVRPCLSCKKHKIKCEVRRGETACVRCLRVGIDCIFSDTGRLVQDDIAWKSEISERVRQLENTVSTLLRENRRLELVRLPPQAQNTVALGLPSVVAVSDSMHTAESDVGPTNPGASHRSSDRDDDDSSLVPAPMNNLYDLAKASSTDRTAATTYTDVTGFSDDLISQGILSEAQARQLFDKYMNLQNQLLWGGVIFPYSTLESMREASVLLSTSILTVAVLHTPGQEETLQRCYNAFIALISNSSIIRHHNIHDVRGLCLGAFHLPNLSWRLSGQAARIAAEMNIHQSFYKVRNGDIRHAERVRMWYALYICNHQVSIAFGRPSAMQDDDAVKGADMFLDGPHPYALPGDTRLIAHVSLYRIIHLASSEFGSDPNAIIDEARLGRLRSVNIAIDQWRSKWEPRLEQSDRIGSYPLQSLVLYYHFARFHLNSLAFRGLRWPSYQTLGSNRREAAMATISAAMNTLVHVSAEVDIRKSLRGVPLFTHTMVAFCATFLLKMASMWHRGDDIVSSTLSLGFNVREVFALVGRSADLLAEVGSDLSEKHVAKHIVAGIRRLLQRVETEANLRNHQDLESKDVNYHGDTSYDSIAVDFAAQQVGVRANELIYNMDVDSLAALLEFGGGETFLTSLTQESDTASMI